MEEKSSEDDTREEQEQEEKDKAKDSPNGLPKAWKFVQNHPKELIIGDPSKKVRTRSFSKQLIHNFALVSLIEPKNVNDALQDENWIVAMQEELNQFERNEVWTLVDRPQNYPIIGTKWVFRNKLNDKGEIVRNKARLVAKGYAQEEGNRF